VIRGHRGRQHLDRDLTFQFGICGAVHLTHAARTEGGENLVRPDARAGGESHALRGLSDSIGTGRSLYRIMTERQHRDQGPVRPPLVGERGVR